MDRNPVLIQNELWRDFLFNAFQNEVEEKASDIGNILTSTQSSKQAIIPSSGQESTPYKIGSHYRCTQVNNQILSIVGSICGIRLH